MERELKALLPDLAPEELAYLVETVHKQREAVAQTRPELAAFWHRLLELVDDEKKRRTDPRTVQEEQRELQRLMQGADSFKPGSSGWVTKAE
jgi:hypothetical protein